MVFSPICLLAYHLVVSVNQFNRKYTYARNKMFSNLIIFKFFYAVDFDMLGLTDNQNPYGVLPPLLGRSLGRKAGSYFADYVAQFLERKRTARSVPPSPKHSQFHGGERFILFFFLQII